MSLILELANKYPTDPMSYSNGKDAYIKETEKKAIRWFESI